MKPVKIIVLSLLLLGVIACDEDSILSTDSSLDTAVPSVRSNGNDAPSPSIDGSVVEAESTGEQCLPCMEKTGDLSSSGSDDGRTLSATVVRVIDGDTVEVILEDGSEDTVRLLGVDTPETYRSNSVGEYRNVTDTDCLDKWGSKATEFAKGWLDGETITLILDPAAGERGYYGRLLAYVHIADVDFNAALVEKGYARVYTEGTASRERQYLRSQRVAISESRGLWDCGQNSRSAENGQVEITLTDFLITAALCEDEIGPDCARLPLGDDYLTTVGPAKGYLFSCQAKNPNAPGSIESKITWIDFVEKTWNFLQKLWLPQGAFRPEPGFYAETVSNDVRLVTVNNLPVDGKIGNWPMTDYPTLAAIDRNPGIPEPHDKSFSYAVNPSMAPTPTCLSLGAIGVTKNGVVIFSAADGRGEDAVAREINDKFGGHPARTEYHYHFIPERLDSQSLPSGHSDVIGYINDGFPIYGYRGEGGKEMTNEDLDVCHGHDHGSLGYHYHATIEYPYTVGCYRGEPT